MLKAKREGPRIPRPQGQSNTDLVVTLLSDEQAAAPGQLLYPDQAQETFQGSRLLASGLGRA